VDHPNSNRRDERQQVLPGGNWLGQIKRTFTEWRQYLFRSQELAWGRSPHRPLELFRPTITLADHDKIVGIEAQRHGRYETHGAIAL